LGSFCFRKIIIITIVEPEAGLGVLRVRLGIPLESGNPVFYIRDNGIGLKLEFHDKVFGIFDKLDVRSEDTGIGFVLVKRIIEAHEGQIWIESDGVDQGTTVCFTLK